MSIRSIIGTVVLLLLAVGSWYFARSLQSGDTERSEVNRVQNGFYVRAARILGTNPDGELIYEIEAEYARQQENSEVKFENVIVNYTTDADVPWTLTADTAIIADDRDYVVLSGHVVAVSDEGFSGQVTEIRTPYLELMPDSFRAETEDDVQIRIGARSLTATGMLALLQSNQLKLKSNVQGRFAP